MGGENLMAKLAMAKKFMDHPSLSLNNPSPSKQMQYEDYQYPDYSPTFDINEDDLEMPMVQPTTQINYNNQNISEEARINKINNSSLPEAVKRAMIENPIEQVSTQKSSFNPDFIEGAKRLMNENGSSSKKPQTQTQKGNISINSQDLIKIISETVEKVLDSKLKQILESQKNDIQTINERLAIKVGDSVFTGKITKVKNVK